MSSVERALKKLQEARAGQSQNRAAPPVARVVDPPAGDQERARSVPSRRIEFDFGALQQAGLYSLDNQRLVDEYRTIKQPVLRKAATGEPRARNNLIMVASSVAGEGKTFTSLNLSLSLASEKDWRVLLVDADCRKPQLSHLLGVAHERGLLDLLKDASLSIDSLVMATNVEGLTVLPLGSPDSQSAELLGSLQMKTLCEHLAASDPRRIVVFDSSPLLLTTEAPILSSQVGQVVMVVLANKTSRHAVLQALEKLDPEKAIGVVLNRADAAGDGLGYGYGYGYGYGSGNPGSRGVDEPASFG